MTQPRISNLMRGKIEAFGLHVVVNMLSAAGMCVTLQMRRAGRGGLVPYSRTVILTF